MSGFRAIVPFAAFGISLLAVQGSIYALQIISAATVDVATFGHIRATESLAAVFALGITFGLPSTLLVHARRSSEQAIIRDTGSASVLSLAATAITVTIAVSIFYAWGLLSSALLQSIVLALPLSLLMALRLVVSAIGQAQQRFVELSKITVVASVVSLGSFGMSVVFGQASQGSWFVARLLLEIIVVVGMWGVSFGVTRLRFIPWKATASRARLLSRSALPLGISLFLRSILDQGPILLVSVMTADKGVIAEVGLIVTLCTVALVPALTAQGVFVPRLVEADAARRSMPYGRLSLYLIIGAATTATIACILLIIVPFLVSWASFPSAAILTLVAIIVAAKMAAGAIGGVLLAVQRNSSILAINVATACLGLAAAVALFSMSENPSVKDFLSAIAIVEVVGAALYVLGLFNHWRKERVFGVR